MWGALEKGLVEYCRGRPGYTDIPPYRGEVTAAWLRHTQTVDAMTLSRRQPCHTLASALSAQQQQVKRQRTLSGHPGGHLVCLLVMWTRSSANP
jgi:hypothetical protein